MFERSLYYSTFDSPEKQRAVDEFLARRRGRGGDKGGDANAAGREQP